MEPCKHEEKDSASFYFYIFLFHQKAQQDFFNEGDKWHFFVER